MALLCGSAQLGLSAFTIAAPTTTAAASATPASAAIGIGFRPSLSLAPPVWRILAAKILV